MIVFTLLSIAGQSCPLINIIIYALFVPSVLMTFVSQMAIIYLIENMTNGWAYFWITVFNVSVSVMIANTTAFIPYHITIMSLFMTLIIVVGLNYYASITNYKYSHYNTLAISVLYATIIHTLVSYYYGFEVDTYISSMISAVLFGLFIVIDTQSLTENNYYINIKNGHYIVAINLYIDVINLFINIVRILNTKYQKVDKNNKNN
jgi:FtsH-binding integral membrane protein